ncbi:MAG: staygreen family protein [Sarcina sp.]
MADANERAIVCEYKGSVSVEQPINHRRYTFLEKEKNDKLVIGLRFDSRNTDSNRNEILGQWAISDDRYVLYFHINIEADENAQSVALRDSMIRSRLVSYIGRILKADTRLINSNEELLKAPVIIYFKCALPYYNRVEKWGIAKDYLAYKNSKFGRHNRNEVEIIKLLMREHIDEKIFGFYNGNKDYNLRDIEFVDIDSKEVLEIHHIEFFVNVEDKDEVKKFKGTIKISNDVIDIVQFGLY